MTADRPSARWYGRWLTALLLGALARLLVIYAPPLAEGITLRLDEALSLFVAIGLGPFWGALTASVATLGTREPGYAVAWITEAVLVGAIVRRGGWPPVVATATYWLLVAGITATGVVAVPSNGPMLQLGLAKQVINGALNAALAQIALVAVARVLRVEDEKGRTPPALREQIAAILVPAVALPVALLTLGLGRMYSTHLDREGERDLAARAAAVATRLSEYVDAATGEVTTLAAELSEQSAPARDLPRALHLHHTGSQAFITMLVTDAEGGILAGSSRIGNETPAPAVAGNSAADRSYFQEPARTGKAFRSEAFQGRGFGADPIVAVSAPYTSPQDGRFAGVVQGSLDLVAFGRWLAQNVPEADASIMVLDAAGRVVASSGPNRAPLLSEGGALEWARATDRSTTATFTDPAERSPGARLLRESASRGVVSFGWQVHLRRAYQAIEAPLAPFYVAAATWLVIVLVLAAPAVAWVSNRITRPLEQLARAAEAVGAAGSATSLPALSPSAPAEVTLLHGELAAMVARLDDSVATLDRRVQERTAELAAATARNDLIVRTASDGMIVVEPALRIVEANDAFCRMSGYSRDHLLTMSMDQLEVGASEDERMARRRTIGEAGSVRFESEIRTRSGASLPVEVVVTAIPNGGGRVFTVIRDISDRKRAESERARAEAQLRQSQKMEAIGTLAGGIAHDFNNILTLITGSVELGGAELPPGHPTQPFLERIRRASDRARALVRQILTFSRPRDEQREIVALGPLLRETASLLRSSLPASIEIRLAIDEDLPTVSADPVQLHQVVMNLGNNSGYAMRDGGGVLTISAHAERRAHDGNPLTACILVADTGVGMDAATLERAFEPFFTTKPVDAGTGLGLAMAHGIVKAHGGTISATSDVGRGTTFRITLPGVGADVEAPAGVESARPTHGHGIAVLVVDDETEIVELVCRQLTLRGFRADGFTGPFDALSALMASPSRYDTILSDQAMPRMSGLDLAERVSREYPHLAFVLCSGRITDDERARAASLGVAAVLEKPFRSEDLARALEDAVTTRRAAIRH